ncbi:MAG: hypothetical protein VX115_02775, partial [Candidatus Thermoplasmatota archaeon]|nr:hypothetical protein [Candidatus Thermoplasmatota archaeon]
MEGFVGVTRTNERTTCVENTCDGVDCGVGAFCRSSSSGNGYECVCDEAHIGSVTQNEHATCTERTCANLGFTDCGANAQCTDTSFGVTCSCTSGAFVGLSVANAPASCSESNCTHAHCPEGSSCIEDDTTTSPPPSYTWTQVPGASNNCAAAQGGSTVTPHQICDGTRLGPSSLTLEECKAQCITSGLSVCAVMLWQGLQSNGYSLTSAGQCFQYQSCSTLVSYDTNYAKTVCIEIWQRSPSPSGYKCVCDDEYVPANSTNGAPLVCVARTCSNPGFSETSDLNHCGVNAICRAAENHAGIYCSCADAYSGDTVLNGPTTCVEKTCAGIDCGASA